MRFPRPQSAPFLAPSSLGPVAALLLLCSAGNASADKPVVVLEAFTGGRLATVAGKVASNALKDKVELYAGTAPAAVVARTEATIAGAEKRGSGITVTIKGTKTGKLETLSYAEVAGKVPGAAFERLAQQLPGAVESAIGHPLSGALPSPPAPHSTELEPIAELASKDPAVPPAAPASAPESTPALTPPEPPVAPAPPEAPAAPSPAAAPAEPVAAMQHDHGGMGHLPWAPAFELAAALLLSGRDFQFTGSAGAPFSSVVTPGLRIDANAYPHANHAGDSRWTKRAMAGLGIGLTADVVFWPATQLSSCPGGGTCPGLSTSERRIQTGLRWRFNLTDSELSPQLLVNAEYGTHQFSIARRVDSNQRLVDAASPDVNYQYFAAGLGVRVPVAKRVALAALAQYQAVFDVGDIQSPTEYGAFGKGSAWGLRAELALQARIYGPLRLRAGGFYERLGLSFQEPPAAAKLPPAPPCPCGATAAVDQFYGGFVGLEMAH